MTKNSDTQKKRNKKGLKIMKWILLALVALLIVGIVFISIKVSQINRKREKVSAEYEISEIREVELGGHRQKILLEGKSKDAPILLYLHGGPGTPFPFCSGRRGLFPEATDNRLIVVWDQYGCGINNHPLDDSFQSRDLVDMTVDLVTILRKEFPENRLTLLGVSWGSYLAAKVAEAVPHLVDDVLIYGQMTKNLFICPETLDALAKANLPEADREKLRRIAESEHHSPEDIKNIAEWLGKYTEAYFPKDKGMPALDDRILGIFFSPDWRLRDALAIFRNGYRTNQTVLNELLTVDLRPVLENISVPYAIFQGEKDLVTPTAAISEFMKTTNNPNLRLEVLPNHSHYPGPDAIERMMDYHATALDAK